MAMRTTKQTLQARISFSLVARFELAAAAAVAATAGDAFPACAGVVGQFSKVLVEDVVLVVLAVRQADEELEQIQHRAAGERVLVPAALVPQVRVAFVVEHFVGGEVHAGVQYLGSVIQTYDQTGTILLIDP